MYNWLDIVIVLILCITFFMGLIKGFVRQVLGIIFVIVGIILAVKYYSFISQFLFHLISHRAISNFIGFLLIFIVVLLIGGALTSLVSKLVKHNLESLDRVLGAVLGLAKGIIICVVLVFALLVFSEGKGSLKESRLATYFISISRAMTYLIPQDLEGKFKEKYEQYREIWNDVNENGKKV